MVGLTPEQINSVMATQANVEQMKNQTVQQAYDAMYKQSVTEKTRRETELLGEDQWEVSEPDTWGRIFRKNLKTGKKEQVSGATPTTPLTFEQKKELASIVKTYDWWRNPETDDIKPVKKDASPPKGYTDRVPSKEVQVSDIPQKRLDLAEDQAVQKSFQVATKRENKKLPAVRKNIAFVNQHSKGTIGLIWLEEEHMWPKPDVAEVTEVVLPKDNNGRQLTLEDIRRVATVNGISVEEVLKQIYAQQKK